MDASHDGSPTLGLLNEWGWLEAPPVFDDHATEPGVHGVVTVRCADLERFLYLAAGLLGVDVHLGSRFVEVDGLHGDSSAGELPRAVVQRNGAQAAYPFHLLLACDGARSASREALGIHVQRNEEVDVDLGGTTRVVHGLHQTSLVAYLKPVQQRGADGQHLDCPELKRVDGQPASPFAVLGNVDGVTSAWKRWFAPVCEIQLLFSEAASSGFWRNGSLVGPDDRRFPWRHLSNVLRLVLRHPPASVDAVQRAVRRNARKPEGEGIAGLDASLIDISLLRATADAAGPLVIGGRATTWPGIALLRGDAASTAHYRLGVGVNNAFAALDDVRRAVAATQDLLASGGADLSKRVSDFVSDIGRSSDRRITSLLATQAHVMAHEAYCGMVVFNGTVLEPEATAPGGFRDVLPGELRAKAYCGGRFATPRPAQ